MLGFKGLLMAGYTPQEARDFLAKNLDEETIKVLKLAASTPTGHRFLLASLDEWRSRDLEPPWADIINPDSLLPQQEVPLPIEQD